MKSPSRLYLDQDRKRVVEQGPAAAFLLAGTGSEIPKEYEAAVLDYLKAKEEAKAEPPEVSDTDIAPAEPRGDPIENRETRVPKVWRKRGRPPKERSE